MNLEEQILHENSKSNINYIVAYIQNDAEKFHNLMELFFKGSYRIAQRAAWVMAEAVDKNPGLVNPYVKQIIKTLGKGGIHDAVKRNSLKILEAIEIPVAHQGRLISTCFDFLSDKKEPVAVKVFAMSILLKLTQNEPDLQKELRILIEDQLPYGSPGFISRGQKILDALR